MSTGRSAPGRRVSPSEHSGPSCLNCARLEGEVKQLRITQDRLIAAAMPGPQTVIKAVDRAENSITVDTPKKLPAKIQRALILQFPERNRERAAHETMARDLLAAGESEGTIAQMIADGRQIEL